MAAAMRGSVLGKVSEHLHSEAAVEAIGDLPPPRSPYDLRRHATRGSGLGHYVISQLVGTLYKFFARMNFVDHAVFQGRLGVDRLASQKRVGGALHSQKCRW
jgi:hypothetical protein